MYVKLTNGIPEIYSVGRLRRDNPNTSFPKQVSAALLAQYGVFECTIAPRPDVPPNQIAIRNDLPTETADGWVMGWTIRDRTADEIEWQTYTEARKAVVVWIDGLTSQIEALYPSAVQKRWEIEEAAARAVDAGNATEEQLELVTREGAVKGRTPQEHAAAIIENATRFRAIADQTNTLFLATDAQLQAASSPLEYPAIFAWAQQQAAPLAAAYGLEV